MIYREGLGRPLSWAELDSNFKEVADTGVAAQTAASSAQVSATTATSAQTSASASATSAGDSAATAKAEADRAKQIAGLDTVADAVGLAALSFPDVWIPLSDSLRMLAGYGREVKVGDDVVARCATLTRNTTATLVNKSQVLTNAAINDARFERGGLLVEQSSTNVINYSTDLSQWTASRVDVSSDIITVNADGYPSINMNMVTNAGLCTASCYVEGLSSVIDQVYLQLERRGDTSKSRGCILNLITGVTKPGAGVVSASARRLGSGYIFQITVESLSGSEFNRLSIFPSSSTRGSGTGQANLTGAVGEKLRVTRVQVEAGSLATSYIPTLGAAVTRAADKLTIPRLNNDCVEWYSGSDPITPIVTTDTIELVPPVGKLHLRNVRGFFAPLTPEQKKALK